MDIAEALAALEPRLRDCEVTPIVGLGLHRSLHPTELSRMQAICPWPLLQHNPEACESLGEVNGIPCQVHPAVARADAVICLGIVELHQYAGFSGGHKAVSVGCGGRDTIEALHSRALLRDPRVQVGSLASPFRLLVDALGRRAGARWALQQVPGLGWVGGPPEAALQSAALALSPWEEVSTSWDRCLLRVPDTKAVNFYQASRAATYLALSPAPPLKKGATLVLDAACPEGLGEGSGEQAFAALLARYQGDLSPLLADDTPLAGGAQRALMLARLMEDYHLVVAGCVRAGHLRDLGIDAREESAEAIAGPEAPSVDQPFLRLPQRAASSTPS